MRKISFAVLVLTLCMLAFQSHAQKKPSVKFTSRSYDYGMIKEQDGKAEGKFVFSNVGDDTLKILDVKPGCGCTTSEWTKGPVLPGKEGYIKALYNPAGRPGKFIKSVIVTTNDPDQPKIQLYIQGDVIPRPRTREDNYPELLGNMRFSSTHVAFADIRQNARKTDTLKFMNSGRRPVALSFKKMPGFLTGKLKPELVDPGREGMLILTFDASGETGMGLVFDRFVLGSNDSLEPEKTFSVSANVTEDFSRLTKEQLEKAPHLVFSGTKFDFGKIQQGTDIPYTFTYTNEGKSTLIIHRITPSCSCISVTPDKYSLEAGESAHLGIVFHTGGREGDQRKTITVLSNDPKSPETNLEVTGFLDKK